MLSFINLLQLGLIENNRLVDTLNPKEVPSAMQLTADIIDNDREDRSSTRDENISGKQSVMHGYEILTCTQVSNTCLCVHPAAAQLNSMLH